MVSEAVEEDKWEAYSELILSDPIAWFLWTTKCLLWTASKLPKPFVGRLTLTPQVKWNLECQWSAPSTLLLSRDKLLRVTKRPVLTLECRFAKQPRLCWKCHSTRISKDVHLCCGLDAAGLRTQTNQFNYASQAAVTIRIGMSPK